MVSLVNFLVQFFEYIILGTFSTIAIIFVLAFNNSWKLKMRLKYVLFAAVASIIICSCFEDNGKDYYNEGMYQYKTKKYEEAIEIFTEGISLKDEYANLNYLGRGASYQKIEKFDIAKQDFLHILKTEKTNPDTLNRDAYWHLAWSVQTKEEKLNMYKKALEYDSRDKRLKMTYGLLLIENDSVQQGVNIMDKLISENFETPYVFNNRALGLIKLKKYGQASKDLKKSLEMDKKNPFVYKNLALLYSETNQEDLACQNINKALSLDITGYGPRKHTLEFEELKSKICL